MLNQKLNLVCWLIKADINRAGVGQNGKYKSKRKALKTTGKRNDKDGREESPSPVGKKRIFLIFNIFLLTNKGNCSKLAFIRKNCSSLFKSLRRPSGV